MKKKKTIIVVIIIASLIVLSVLGYFGYKFYLINKYETIVNQTALANLNSNSKIVIMPNNGGNNDYTSYENINFVLPQGFEIISTANDNDDNNFNLEDYYLNYDNGRYDASISVGVYPNLYNALTNNDNSFFDLDSIKDLDTVKLLNNEEIYNNTILYEEMFEEYGEVSDVFDEAKDIKLNYLLNNLYNTVIGDKNITLIDEGLEGYMITVNNNQYEVHLLSGQNEYIFIFKNENSNYFNKAVIQDFLYNVVL